MNIKPAQVVKFTYRFHTGATPDEILTDHKEVLVLHPNWQGKMHGIDMGRLTMAEREVLQEIFDPSNRGKPHRIPLIEDVLRRMDPIEDIKNPMSFYSKFVKVFLRDKDAYRTYFPARMLNTIVVEQSKVAGKVTNPKPLFHKVESKKPEQTQQQKPMANRLDLIRQRAQSKKGSDDE